MRQQNRISSDTVVRRVITLATITLLLGACSSQGAALRSPIAPAFAPNIAIDSRASPLAGTALGENAGAIGDRSAAPWLEHAPSKRVIVAKAITRRTTKTTVSELIRFCWRMGSMSL